MEDMKRLRTIVTITENAEDNKMESSEEIRRMFDQDTRIKKNIAASARAGKPRRKGGSASISRSEYLSKCSGPFSIKLGEPATLPQFLAMSKDAQVIYLNDLYKEHGATDYSLAKMFNISRSKMLRIREGLKVKGTKPGRCNKDDAVKWERFIGDFCKQQASPDTPKPAVPAQEKQKPAEPMKPAPAPAQDTKPAQKENALAAAQIVPEQVDKSAPLSHISFDLTNVSDWKSVCEFLRFLPTANAMNVKVSVDFLR